MPILFLVELKNKVDYYQANPDIEIVFKSDANVPFVDYVAKGIWQYSKFGNSKKELLLQAMIANYIDNLQASLFSFLIRCYFFIYIWNFDTNNTSQSLLISKPLQIEIKFDLPSQKIKNRSCVS